MKRSSIRKPYVKPERSMPKPIPAEHRRPAVMWAANDSAPVVIEKTEPVRSREYRMWVASLPCISCGIVGYSQAAHSNSPEHGKSGARKADDAFLFPLCASRLGHMGCHVEFDSGAMFTKAERRGVTAKWVRDTQSLAAAAGWNMQTLKRTV